MHKTSKNGVLRKKVFIRLWIGPEASYSKGTEEELGSFWSSQGWFSFCFRRLICICSCSLLVKKIVLQPTSLAKASTVGVTLSQCFLTVCSQNSSELQSWRGKKIRKHIHFNVTIWPELGRLHTNCKRLLIPNYMTQTVERVIHYINIIRLLLDYF